MAALFCQYWGYCSPSQKFWHGFFGCWEMLIIHIPLCQRAVQDSPRACSRRGVLLVSARQEWVAPFLPYQPLTKKGWYTADSMNEWVSCLPLASWIHWVSGRHKVHLLTTSTWSKGVNFWIFMNTIPVAGHNWAAQLFCFVSLHKIITIRIEEFVFALIIDCNTWSWNILFQWYVMALYCHVFPNWLLYTFCWGAFSFSTLPRDIGILFHYLMYFLLLLLLQFVYLNGSSTRSTKTFVLWKSLPNDIQGRKPVPKTSWSVENFWGDTGREA